MDTQLGGELAHWPPQAADGLHRISFELSRELAFRSTPSQQDSFPAHTSILLVVTLSLWRRPATGAISRMS